MNTKRCTRCGTVKPLKEFHWHRKAKGQRNSYCRSCQAAYKQEHYARNRERYLENAAAWARKAVREWNEFLISYFKEHPCTDCGQTDPLVLEFDHVRGEKRFQISDGPRLRSRGALIEEMKKCEVVCANCHRRRTAERVGFARVLHLDQSG
jgi:hypothetical protein